jgi:16S rRNA (adenine1518-N6/adenine1519-N6)-dimethyltransferase
VFIRGRFPPVKLSEIKQILTERGIQLTKSLGQNFLHDGNQLRRITDAANLSATDKVLEIGPGLGPLTELLVKHAGEVLAIEKDTKLFEALRARIKTPSFNLRHDDALDYLKRETRDWRGWKVVSNLPYSVASPILVELAQAQHGPELIVATLQLEVAKRLMAAPGEKDYGLLTLLINLEYEPKGSFKIPASCFFPEPDVDSACVCLVRRVPALLAPAQKPIFTKIVKRAFSQRRKMMLKLLKQDWPANDLERIFQFRQLPVQIRAENVTLEQFVQLTRLLLKDSPHD